MGSGPIFIGGLSFSGKTLLRLMLTSHPNIAITRRTYMWPRYYGRYGDVSQPDNFERCLSAMLRHKHMQALKPDPERIRREFWQGPPTYARLFALFQGHYAERLGKPRWGDQLGFIERYADPIFAAYPTAKMIHMIRDPRDRYEAAVTPSQHRKGKVGWDTAKWLQSVGLARRNQRRYPDRYQIVRYETLVAQPEKTLREVCALIDEAFVPAMLSLEDALRFSDEEGDGANGAPRLRATPAALSRASGNVMSKREIAFTQAHAGRDMLACGYLPQPIRFSLSDRLLFYVVDWPANLAGMLAWRTRGARQPAAV